MSYGVSTTREQPELYVPTGREMPSIDYPNWGDPYSGAHFLQEKYLKSGAKAVLGEFNMGSSHELENINIVIGAVLRNIQKASLVPVEMAREYSAKIDNDMASHSTLSPEVLVATMRECVDGILDELGGLIASKSPLKKEAQEILERFAVGRKFDRRSDFLGQRKMPPQRYIVDDFEFNGAQKLKDADVLNPDTRASLGMLSRGSLGNIEYALHNFMDSVYARAFLSTSSFKREVGDPSLREEKLYVSPAGVIENNIPERSIIVYGDTLAQAVRTAPQAYVACATSWPSHCDPRVREGILPKDATQYSTLNPRDLVELMLEKFAGSFLTPLLWSSLGIKEPATSARARCISSDTYCTP